MNASRRRFVDLSEEDLTLFDDMASAIETCQERNQVLYAQGFEMYLEMLKVGFIIPRHSIIRITLQYKPEYLFLNYIVHDTGYLLDLDNKHLYDPQVVLSLSYAPLGWNLVNPTGVISHGIN